MTEYAIAPHRLPEYMSARERTARWVNHYSPENVYSPSYPPTPIEGCNVPPSPAASTHSLPPKMVLRYNDGRGDIPIQGNDYHGRSDRRHRAPHSNASSPLSPRPHDSTPPPSTPEKIRVLPSRPINATSSTSTSSSRQSHTRSKSTSRHDYSFAGGEVPAVPHIRAPLAPISPPGVQPYSPWHAGHSRHASAYPASQPHYDPRAFHHPSRVGPDGMIYSHSAPPIVGAGAGSHYAPQQPGMYPSPVHGHGDERMGRSREHDSRTHGRRRHFAEANSSDSAGSDDSTYYMSPTGDKIHVLEHSPERSVDTASSATKVGSPWSQTAPKKPFFSRIFGLGGQKSSPGSKPGSHPNGRKLHRRHSIGDAQRPTLELD